MEKCVKCNQPKQIEINEFTRGINVCMCDWDFSKVFSNCSFLLSTKALPTLDISEIQNIALNVIGHIYSIEGLDDKTKEELAKKLQKIYRITMSNNN